MVTSQLEREQKCFETRAYYCHADTAETRPEHIFAELVKNHMDGGQTQEEYAVDKPGVVKRQARPHGENYLCEYLEHVLYLYCKRG